MQTLLQNQSIIDAVACFIGCAFILQPKMWVPGVYILDLPVCHIWHGHQAFWITMYISIWNLVCLAYERFLAVVRPFKHQDFTHKRLHIMMAIFFSPCVFMTVGGFLQVRYVDGKCTSQDFNDSQTLQDFLYFHCIMCFFGFYVVPTILFIILYGRVITAFQSRKKSDMGASRVIDKATTELTKTAITVTVIFFITIGTHYWNYMLGYTNVIEYVINSPVQMITTLLSVVNSAANPFVYGLLVPAYRQSVKSTLCMCFCRTQGKNREDNTTT